MQRTKTFDPTSTGWNDSWRTLDWLARNCLDFSFNIRLIMTKQKVLEMLSQVHRNLETGLLEMPHKAVDWPPKQVKNRPVLQWSDGRVITAK